MAAKAVKAEEVIKHLEGLAPLHLAEEWDNSGWQLGDPRREVRGIFLTLDAEEESLEEAKEQGANLMITHHPLFFRPLSQLRVDRFPGNLVEKFFRYEIMLYSAHTNLDNAPEGVSQVLARKLGLTRIEVCGDKSFTKLYKLVVFVPLSHLAEVREAICRAGGGWIGRYSDCTFRTAGIGTFRPHEGTQPFVGEVGKLEEVEEFRLETVVPEASLNSVIKAMLAAHPYEEPAYDVYPLAAAGEVQGALRAGFLPEKMPLEQLAQHVKRLLDAEAVRVVGDPSHMVDKVAVCGGSGAGFISLAVRSGAQVLITGDLKYHEAQDAVRKGLMVIAAGHEATEWPVVEFLAEWLRQRLPGIPVAVGKRKREWGFVI